MEMPLTTEQVAKLEEHEGFRSKVYKCTAGFDTIGIGYNLQTNMLKLSANEIKSLYDVGVTHEKAVYYAKLCCNMVETELSRELSWYDTLDSNTKFVLISLGFNMGVQGLLKFTKTLALIRVGKFTEASRELLNSKWATQVDKKLGDGKGRADDLAIILKTGKIR